MGPEKPKNTEAVGKIGQW